MSASHHSPRGAGPTRVGLLLLPWLVVAGCTLDEAELPLTGTSSSTTSTSGAVTNGGNPPSSPPPTSPPAAPPAGSPTDVAQIFDPLTNRMSVGEVGGGVFTTAGWRVIQRGNFIRYRVPPIVSGFFEWENRNLTPFNPQRDLFSLIGMWDPSAGAYRENPFRVHVRKLDTAGHNPPYVRLRFIANGEQHDKGFDFLEWNPNQTYRWRLEWGPNGERNQARVLLDDRVIIRQNYNNAYRPNQHWIELGVEERSESIVGVIYRNVRIGRR